MKQIPKLHLPYFTSSHWWSLAPFIHALTLRQLKSLPPFWFHSFSTFPSLFFSCLHLPYLPVLTSLTLHQSYSSTLFPLPSSSPTVLLLPMIQTSYSSPSYVASPPTRKVSADMHKSHLTSKPCPMLLLCFSKQITTTGDVPNTAMEINLLIEIRISFSRKAASLGHQGGSGSLKMPTGSLWYVIRGSTTLFFSL